MKLIEVIHNGKLRRLPANEAKVLLLLKKATLPPEPVALVAPTVVQPWKFPKATDFSAKSEESDADKPAKPKRQYRRRDMTAET